MLSYTTILRETLSEPHQLEWLAAIERSGRRCVESLLRSRSSGAAVAPEVVLRERTDAAPGRVDLRGRRILVADDDDDLCVFVRQSLESAGGQVSVVGDGNAVADTTFAAAASGKPFDVVLVDIDLPTKSGLEVTEDLRKRGYSGIIVAYTSSDDANESERCLNAGCDAFVAKTFGGAQLPELIQNCCDHFSDRDVRNETDEQHSDRADLSAGKRILIVDDNADTLDAMAALLDRRGHSARVAVDGSTAIEIARTFDPEIALIDLRLPDMDGVTLLGRLRQVHDGLLAFAVSGLDSRQAREQALDHGFDRFFVKPVDFDDITQAIDG